MLDGQVPKGRDYKSTEDLPFLPNEAAAKGRSADYRRLLAEELAEHASSGIGSVAESGPSRSGPEAALIEETHPTLARARVSPSRTCRPRRSPRR